MMNSKNNPKKILINNQKMKNSKNNLKIIKKIN